HFHAGDLARSRALLVELVAGAEAASVRSNVLRLLGEACYRLGFMDDAVRYLRQAVDEAGEDAGLVAAAELAFAVAVFYSGKGFDRARAAIRRAVQAAEAHGDDSLLSDALAGSAMAELLVGHGLDEKMLERALALEDRESSKPVERRPTLLAGLAF